MRKITSCILVAVVLLILILPLFGTVLAQDTPYAEYIVKLYRSHGSGQNTLPVYLNLSRLQEPVQAVEFTLHYDSDVMTFVHVGEVADVSQQATQTDGSGFISGTGKQLHIKAERQRAFHGAGRMVGVRFQIPEGATGITRIYLTDMVTTGTYQGTSGARYTPGYPAYIDIDLAQDENVLLDPTEPTEPTVQPTGSVVPSAKIAPFLSYGNGLRINMRVEQINIPYHRVDFTLHYDPSWLRYENEGAGDLSFSGGVTRRSSSNQFIPGGLTLDYSVRREEDQEQKHPGTLGSMKFFRDPLLQGYTRLYISDVRIYYFDENGQEQSFVPDYNESFAVQMRETANMGYVNMYPTEPKEEAPEPSTAPSTEPPTEQTTAATTAPTVAETTVPATEPAVVPETTTVPTTESTATQEPTTVPSTAATVPSATSSVAADILTTGTEQQEKQTGTLSSKPDAYQQEQERKPISVMLISLIAVFVIAVIMVVWVILRNKKK